jgi:hypothetical protein
MSDAEDRLPEVAGNRDGAPGAGRSHRMRVRFAAARARAKNARERHVSVAVPFRAAERNRRVASSVLAGGIAYRLFLWLLPFGLILGGAFGLMDAEAPRMPPRTRVFPRRSSTRSATPRVPPVPTHGGSWQSACRSSSMRATRARRRCS